MGATFGEGDSRLILDLCPPEVVSFEAVRDEVRWHTMLHKGGPVPRLIAIQGNLNDDGSYPVYRHPAEQQPVLLPWSPLIKPLRRAAEQAVGHELNHALIQWYRCGSDNISEHADKTLDIKKGSYIVNLSLGATRTMVLRRKEKLNRDVQRIRLPHNSLFVLGWETNRSWLHAINRDGRADDMKEPDVLAYGGHRISITFRHIATFRTADGHLMGQGAPTVPRQLRPEEERAEQAAMLKAFGVENHTQNFDWMSVYGDGFGVYNIEEIGSGEGVAPSRRTALLLIDLQNDFLSGDPQCFFAKRSVDTARLRSVLPGVAKAVADVRSAGGLIVWVRAVYGGWGHGGPPQPQHSKACRGGLPSNSDFHAHTHTGSDACCARKSLGAELHPEAAALVHPCDFVMEKRWYSAFTETPLTHMLEARGVDRVVLCGLVTNVCVQATAVDAFHLGHEVVLLEDACQASTLKLHSKGLAELEPYACFVESAHLVRRFPVLSVRQRKGGRVQLSGRLSGFGAGDCIVVPDFLPAAEADAMLKKLVPEGQEVSWGQLTHLKHGSAFPRLTSFQAEPNEWGHLPAYRCADPQPWDLQYSTSTWTPSVKEAKGMLESVAQHSFNWCRLLLYRSNGDGMGFHSDKCLDLRKGSYIASLSLGQKREYELQPKCGKGFDTQTLSLGHNTLLLLGPETNRRFLHSLKKTRGGQQQHRVSITFRDVATYHGGGEHRPGLDDFYGQGTHLPTFMDWQRSRRTHRACGTFTAAAVALGMCFLAGGPRNKSGVFAGVGALLACVAVSEARQRQICNTMRNKLDSVFVACNKEEIGPDEARAMLYSVD
mmetsp:Transcript_14191/g.39021  ORF Transcript_14191/g.39021 Transcript_14191/m.39021 type:complete len:827 (-) Transcript_14191:142-2622(-)